MRHGDTAEYNALKKEWLTTTSVDGKEITLRAMGRLQNTTLLPDFLEFLFKDVATQDKHTGGMALGANPKTRYEFWQYIKENFDTIHASLSKNMVVLDRFIKLSLQRFNDKKAAEDIATFFKDKDNRGYDRTLGIVNDTILGRATYKERDAAVILEWLKAHGYA